MSDLFGNHIVGFPTRRLIYILYHLQWNILHWMHSAQFVSNVVIILEDGFKIYSPHGTKSDLAPIDLT